MQTSSTPTRRPWDWPSAVLVFLLLQVAAARLVITSWTPFLFFTQTLSAFSVVLGLTLGYSRFRPRTVRWLAFLYTLVVIPWQLTLADNADALYLDHLASIGGRMWISLGNFIFRRPVDDALFFVAFVSLAFWIVGISAGYALTRHGNYLGTVIPAGLITLFVQLYDFYIPVRIWGFAIYIFVALLLLGRIYLSQNRKSWDEKRMFVTSESTQDLANSLLALAAVLVFVAWSLPTSLSSIQSAGKAWDNFTRPIRERLSNGVSALVSPYGSGSGQSDFYGDKLSLGVNAAQGDTPIFSVQVLTQVTNKPPRYYWRGRVYDTYTNGQWTSAETEDTKFVPSQGDLIQPVSSTQTSEVRFRFTMQLSRQGLMYTPPMPIWVDRPSKIQATKEPNQLLDLAAWVAEPVLSAGDRYQVYSVVGNPSIEELRAAGTDYPTWVADRYLQIGDDLSAKLQPLAGQVTDGQETPYDKAEAITEFLRSEIKYSTNLPAPPRGVDPLVWVLFDNKQGFCMYYASAEVMMLRSLGVPARMVVGFSQGQAKNSDSFTIQRKNAHAWPEVYFPGIGWVEFEPTGNQDPLIRPTAPPPTPDPSNSPSVRPQQTLTQEDSVAREPRIDESGVTEQPPFSQTSAGRTTFIMLGFLVAAILLLANRRYGLADRLPVFLTNAYARNGTPPPSWLDRWMRWNHLSSIERSFHAVNFSLRWLGKPQPMHVTPTERASILKGILPSAEPAIDILLAEHQATLYSPKPGNAIRARRAALTLLSYSLRARLHQMWIRLQNRFGLFG